MMGRNLERYTQIPSGNLGNLGKPAWVAAAISEGGSNSLGPVP